MKATNHKDGFSALVIIGIVAVLAIAGGFAYMKMKQSATTSMMPTDTAAPVAVVNSPSVTPSKSPAALSAESSDSSLDKDATDINTKLNALNNDSVNIDQGLNDKQGNLSEQ